MSRSDRIERALNEVFAPCEVSVRDDSWLHQGHAGARDGRGHFTVTIISGAFDGLRPLERHRKVYAALGEMMDTDIHALQIRALTPEEKE